MTSIDAHGNERHAMGVDQFVSDDAIAQFRQRQADVLATADYYGLNDENALAIGGGALALHGIDTYVPTAGEEPFDLDVLAVQDERYRRGIGAVLRKLVVPEVSIYHDRAAPLSLTVIRGNTANNFARDILRYPDFKDMVDAKALSAGLATPALSKLVAEKLAAGRPKDTAGLIKAHAVATELNDPIVDTPGWNKAIGIAIHKAGRAQRRPEWLIELVENDFNHPAYKRIPRR